MKTVAQILKETDARVGDRYTNGTHHWEVVGIFPSDLGLWSSFGTETRYHINSTLADTAIILDLRRFEMKKKMNLAPALCKVGNDYVVTRNLYSSIEFAQKDVNSIEFDWIVVKLLLDHPTAFQVEV